MEPARIREIAISRWWNGADLSAPIETVDGRPLHIVFRGNWSHGLGPDFQGALVDFGDGRLVSGDIEIHRNTGAWRQHGHHLDPRYNAVMLHIVLEHDGAETRRSDGRIVPTAIIEPAPSLLSALQSIQFDWNLVGGLVCAETVARDDPAAIRAVLWQLGDRRLGTKVAQFSARLDRDRPADLLFESIMDGLGFSSNREPMRQLAARMPVETIDALLATVPSQDRFLLAAGLLLGTAGFLPLAPADAASADLAPDEVAAVEQFWSALGGPWHRDRLAPTTWNRTRVRPANHPATRLRMAASLLTSSFEGLASSVVDTVRAGDDPVALLIARSGQNGKPGMGESRAIAIVASAVIPWLLALADSTGDLELAERASHCWEVLPAGEPNQITRRAMAQIAGAIDIGHLGERGMQGSIELDRNYCQPRRCLECSIAYLALSQQPMPDQAALE